MKTLKLQKTKKDVWSETKISYSSLTSHQTSLQVLCSALGSPANVHGPAGVSSEEGHKDTQRTEASLLWRQAETEGSSAHRREGRGIATSWSLRYHQGQTILWFCELFQWSQIASF